MKVKLHKGQFEVATDTHRFKVICAGRRWGKSVLSRMIMLKWALENPGLYWIVSPTFQQGKDIHWLQGFKQELPREAVSKWNDSELSVTLINGAVIQLKSSENPDRLKGVKLRGLIVDEIAMMKNWNWIWKEALRPTLTDYQSPALFISTPRGYNHFFDLFELEKENNDFKSWQFTSYDNPYIPREEIDKARGESTEEYFAQEYLAEFKKFVGLVYNEFERGIHVRELKDFRPVYYIRGLDRGFRNPTAACLVAVDKDGVWYQTHEIYQAGLTNPQLARLLKDQREGLEIEYSTMDSAQASDIQDLSDLGEDFVPVEKESGESKENYVRYKVQKFAERLRVAENGRAGFYVHPRCTSTIEEFENYRWKEKTNRTFDDTNDPEQPEKANDHMMDALSDLNAMYLHTYEETIPDPTKGKIPGTFVTPITYLEQMEGESDFTKDTGYDW